MTIYHAAVTPDGYPDRMQTFASVDEQDVYRDIWKAVARRPWKNLWRYEADASVVEVVKTAVADGDWKTAVQEVARLEKDNLDGMRYRVGETDLSTSACREDLSGVAQTIADNVDQALQNAEEIWGSGDAAGEYVQLMNVLSVETTRRAEAMKKRLSAEE